MDGAELIDLESLDSALLSTITNRNIVEFSRYLAADLYPVSGGANEFKAYMPTMAGKVAAYVVEISQTVLINPFYKGVSPVHVLWQQSLQVDFPKNSNRAKIYVLPLKDGQVQFRTLDKHGGTIGYMNFNIARLEMFPVGFQEEVRSVQLFQAPGEPSAISICRLEGWRQS